MSEFLTSAFTILILLSGMFAVLLPLMLLVWHRDRTVKLPIDRAGLLRLPGYGLEDEMRSTQLDVFVNITNAIIIIALPYAAYSAYGFIKNNDFPWLVIIFTLIGIPYFSFTTIALVRKLTRLRLGYVAELATAAELMLLQAKGYQVFHDIQADKFNIDHLVIGPNGVFSLETKGRHKRLGDTKTSRSDDGVSQRNYELIFKNGMLEFPSWRESKPLEQAERQADWVSHWLSKSTGLEIVAVPILVFPGWFIKLQTRPPFPVLNHKQILGTIPKVGNCQLSQDQINAIAWQVAQRAVEGPKE